MLGRLLREHSTVIPREGLVRVTRDVRYPSLAMYAGLIALAIGSYLGVGLVVDGVRAASPSMLGTGLFIALLGLGLDFVLSSWCRGSAVDAGSWCRGAVQSSASPWSTRRSRRFAEQARPDDAARVSSTPRPPSKAALGQMRCARPCRERMALVMPRSASRRLRRLPWATKSMSLTEHSQAARAWSVMLARVGLGRSRVLVVELDLAR